MGAGLLGKGRRACAMFGACPKERGPGTSAWRIPVRMPLMGGFEDGLSSGIGMPPVGKSASQLWKEARWNTAVWRQAPRGLSPSL